MSKAQLLIGIMSGTSLDGVDAALVLFENGTCQLKETQFLAYTNAIKAELLALHEPKYNELEAACILGCSLAHLYANAVKKLLIKAKVNAADIVAIGCHGQTVRHRPELKFTLQIGNNALLAELTNISVVGDFRSRDIAAGGQGAPLVPAFHQAMFGSKKVNRAIVNIGGIANITYLPTSGNVLGFDTGPGNMLLDSWTKLNTGSEYDKNGEWSATGEVVQAVLSGMLAEPYFALPPPKSTGRDLFNDHWFNDHWLKQHQLYPHLRPQDVARTLVALTAHTIANAIAQDCIDKDSGDVDEVYVCGGGAHNSLLMQSLADMMHGRKLATTKDLGIDVDWVEAVAFAWLAKQTIENQPSNLPTVTGAKGLRVLGAVYPA